MHRVWVLIAGLALIGASLALGLMDRTSADYSFADGSNCGSVLLPAKFFEGGYVGERDCEVLLDGARTDVYALLGLGAIVVLAGSVWVIAGIRADHHRRHHVAEPARSR